MGRVKKGDILLSIFQQILQVETILFANKSMMHNIQVPMYQQGGAFLPLHFNNLSHLLLKQLARYTCKVKELIALCGNQSINSIHILSMLRTQPTSLFLIKVTGKFPVIKLKKKKRKEAIDLRPQCTRLNQQTVTIFVQINKDTELNTPLKTSSSGVCVLFLLELKQIGERHDSFQVQFPVMHSIYRV